MPHSIEGKGRRMSGSLAYSSEWDLSFHWVREAVLRLKAELVCVCVEPQGVSEF